MRKKEYGKKERKKGKKDKRRKEKHFIDELKEYVSHRDTRIDR